MTREIPSWAWHTLLFVYTMMDTAFVDSESKEHCSGLLGEFCGQGMQISSEKESVHGKMATDSELESLKGKLVGVIKVPEIVFSRNMLQLHHPQTGLTIQFHAMDALKAWKSENLPPVQLGIAKEWRNERVDEIKQHCARQLHYDWTFTTPYKGTYLQSAAKGSAESLFVPSDEGLNLELLKSKEDPILLYDALSLYESELDDMGSCLCKVWVRVMPRYWFVVLRFFLRVDQNLIRLRETRLFSRLSEGNETEVLRDTKHWELTFDQLRANGAPSETTAYREAESTSTVLQSIFPAGLSSDTCEKLELDGQVNEKDTLQTMEDNEGLEQENEKEPK